MIVTDLVNGTQQVALPSAIRKGLDFLVQMQGQALADGRIDIEGQALYALVQSYTSKSRDSIWFEAHRKYIDIQYVVEGEEYEGWAPLSALQVTNGYNMDKDVLHGTVAVEDMSLIRLKAGQVAIFYPTDAHAPGLSIDESMPIKKIVVKVALEA